MEEYQSKIETVIIRPGFNIYGPNDRMTSKEMLDRLSKGQLMGYVDGGKSKLGFVYAENLVFGLLCAGTHPSAANNTFIASITSLIASIYLNCSMHSAMSSIFNPKSITFPLICCILWHL